MAKSQHWNRMRNYRIGATIFSPFRFNLRLFEKRTHFCILSLSIGLCIISSNHTLISVPIEMTLAWLFSIDAADRTNQHRISNRNFTIDCEMHEQMEWKKKTQNEIEGSLIGIMTKEGFHINIKCDDRIICCRLKNIIIIVNFITHHFSSTFFSSVTSSKGCEKEP